jgi:hypothetical protein
MLVVWGGTDGSEILKREERPTEPKGRIEVAFLLE